MKYTIYTSTFFFSILLVILESNTQLGEVRLTTDFVSWALSGMAPVFGIGTPYTNYWGINPPGVLLFTTVWGILFGSSLQSFHILYIVSLILIIILVWLILNKLFTLFESWIIFFVFFLIFFSSTVQSQFFPSEINGLLFTLLGLNLVITKNIPKKHFFWASFFFILSGQMKEVFAFSGFALLPHLLIRINDNKNEIKSFLTYTLLGIFSSILIIVGYLQINNALIEYKNVLDDKSERFSITDTSRFEGNFSRSINFPKERFIQINYQLTFLLFVTFLCLLFYLSLIARTEKGKYITEIKLPLPKKMFEYSVILFFWIGSTLGYMMQGRYGNKYEIQSLLPMMLIITISLKIVLKSLFSIVTVTLPKSSMTFIFLILLLVFITPKKFFFVELLSDVRNYSYKLHVNKWKNLENEESIKLETYVKSKTTSDDCITAVYGWGVGSHYYYSKRKSCSKHFLVNIIAPENWKEYRSELINNPPKAIIYITGGADIDIAQFESNVFNFTKVIEQCYKKDKEFAQLYWIKTDIDSQSCLRLGYNQDI